MYDNWNIADPEDLAHKTKHNWSVIAQRGNNCVREYSFDKKRFVVDSNGKLTNKTVTSQAFIFYANRKSVFVLQVWPLSKPLTFPNEVIKQRRAKAGLGRKGLSV